MVRLSTCRAVGSSPVSYTVRKDDHRIDMEQVAALAKEHKPKCIIAGGSGYSRIWDFEGFRKIADSVGAYFMVDMAHFAGLVAAGLHPLAVSACACRHHHDP